MTPKKFYITTPIYYPNDIPHIGHAYTTIAADVLARYHKLKGEEVFFLTGTDEHGKKIEQVAKDHNKKPKEFVDELAPKFKEAWKKLDIEYDRFIRTTDKDHEKVVQEVLDKCYKNGDIYKGFYEGWYCTPCEAYYTEKDLINENECPIHKTKIEKLKEESYFFKLSKYEKKLLDFYKKNPDFILPASRKNEVTNRVKDGLKDLSISRTSFDWGIALPFDKKHVCYVWFDALFNYYSGTKGNSGKYEKFWPANVHLIGKDILWFHAVYWPAFLMSAGFKEKDLPKTIFAHGWWTFDKEKISKSRGKVINVDELISIAGVDAARYFLFREAVFGEDGDFSRTALIKRFNNELADKLGNLVSRVGSLIEKNGVKKCENKLLKKLNHKKIDKHYEKYELDKALQEIFSFIDVCNEYVQNKRPWGIDAKDKEKVLFELKESILVISDLLYPFIPNSASKIKKQFTAKNITKGEVLFKKIEDKFAKEKETLQEKVNKSPKIEGIMTLGEVDFSDWTKLDLRVAKILESSDIEGADKLYKLSLDVGKEIGRRTICAGIKQYYSKKELEGKKIILFVNLKPRMMKGIESQGMLLAAGNEDHSKVILISPEKDIEVGSKVN